MITLENGHELDKDRWQWIVKHPYRCANARRGSSYAKYTYFREKANLAEELVKCGCQVPNSLP